jgi:hypothetical protein
MQLTCHSYSNTHTKKNTFNTMQHKRKYQIHQATSTWTSPSQYKHATTNQAVFPLPVEFCSNNPDGQPVVARYMPIIGSQQTEFPPSIIPTRDCKGIIPPTGIGLAKSAGGDGTGGNGRSPLPGG